MEKFKPLTESLITKDDLVFYSGELSRVENLIHENDNASLSEKVEGKLPPPLEAVVKEMDQGASDPDQQKEVLAEIDQHLREFSRLRVTLAFSPPRDFLKEIKERLASEIEGNFVLDLVVEPEIVGGIVFEFEGNFVDLSLKNNLDFTSSLGKNLKDKEF